MSEAETAAIQPPPPESAWRLLGGLRFALALIVVCGHLKGNSNESDVATAALAQIGQLDPVCAVICFLVLSGFSIAHSITERPEGYLRRRIVRIYPLYLFALLAALAVQVSVAAATGAGTIPTRDLLGFACNAVFLQGIACRTVQVDAPLWTLGVEVACYVLAPIFARMQSRTLLLIGAASALGYAAYPWLHLPFYSFLHYGQALALLFWAWIGGFVFYRHREDWRAQAALMIVGVALFAANGAWRTSFTSLTFVVSMALVIWSSRVELGRRAGRVLAYLGELSYPLYLLHLPTYIAVRSLLGLPLGPVMIGAALLVTVAAYHLIDRPIRLSGRRSRELVRVAAG